MTASGEAHVGRELGAVNYQDLAELYFERSGAVEAMREFNRVRNGTSSRRLDRLLRSHICRAVDSARELELRDAFDDLLSFYALLEIACALGYVNAPDESVRKMALRVLADEDVTTFYRVHYPLLLPELFRRRVAGERDVVLAPDDVHLGAFHRFLDLNATLEASANATDFLSLLDDYVLGDNNRSYDINDLFAVLGRPKEFLSRLSRPEQKQDDLDSALHGFRVYLRFCRNFDELLRSLERYPMQQSLLWHHHAYWFECIRDQAGDHLHHALRRITSWDPRDSRDEGREADARSVASMHDVIRRLTSGRYGWALREGADRLAT